MLIILYGKSTDLTSILEQYQKVLVDHEDTAALIQLFTHELEFLPVTKLQILSVLTFMRSLRGTVNMTSRCVLSRPSSCIIKIGPLHRRADTKMPCLASFISRDKSGFTISIKIL